MKATVATITGFVALLSCCLLPATAIGVTLSPAQKCQIGKNQAAGAYSACRQNAEATLIRTGYYSFYSSAITRCENSFASKWQKLIDKATAAAATCFDAPLTATQFKTLLDANSSNITTALAGGGLEDCPNDLSSCESNLSACLASTLPAARVLTTGQTGCYDTSGNGIPCAGTGQDGELQKGVVHSYTDNGDGTISDNQTGLMWEKKSRDGSIHDMDALYNFSDAIGVFIAGLNTANFAGYSDWRLPNRFELETLVDLGQENPSIDGSFFNTNCLPLCLVGTCSCTGLSAGYWSSSAAVPTPSYAWVVYFNLGGNGFDLKTNPDLVRAVRGGV